MLSCKSCGYHINGKCDSLFVCNDIYKNHSCRACGFPNVTFSSAAFDKRSDDRHYFIGYIGTERNL